MKNARLAYLFDEAIKTLQQYEPPEGYYVAFSGGKDSIVILDLVRRSGCKHDVHFSKTSVDPPELLQFIKDYYPDINWHKPPLTMFQLIVKKKYLPTSRIRYCCAELKERGGSGRVVITGIRKAESHRRAKRSMFEISKTDKSKSMIHIIIEWKDYEVWNYIKLLNLPYCKLYDEGWKRIGCIGCPLASKKDLIRQFNRYPNHKKAYIWAIAKALNIKPSIYFGKNAELLFDWWISNLSISKYLGLKEQTEIDFVE